MKRGAADAIVDGPPSRRESMFGREKRKRTLSFMLDSKYDFDKRIEELDTKVMELEEFLLSTELPMPQVEEKLKEMKAESERLRREVYDNLTPWQRVLVARHPYRPTMSDYIEYMLDDFLELQGDRRFGEDGAIRAGFARISDEHGSVRVMAVGHDKGITLTERMERNFGCAHPEGYRKALLKMELAERFGLPILCFIDTPGAHPGLGAEERGQAFAIADNLMRMSELRVPIVATVIGEGGSGGALGIGVADRLLMLEFAYYSVISPEGCAAILWRGDEKDHLDEAAENLKLTAHDLHSLEIVDEVVPEPLGGAHRDHEEAARILKSVIMRHLREAISTPADELVRKRYRKYRRMGRFVQRTADVSDA